MNITEKHTEPDFGALLESIYIMGTNFLRQGKFEKALIIFDGLMALIPEQMSFAVAYGEALLMAGKKEEAANHFSSVFERLEPDCNSVMLAAKAHLSLSRLDEAKKLLSLILSGKVTASQQDLFVAESMMQRCRFSEN